jgi:6-phosphogluconate dehydrogenase (decarboxylating)
MGTALQKFAVIGFGEAGSILGEDLVAAGREVAMYDILLDSTSSRAQMRDRAQRMAKHGMSYSGPGVSWRELFDALGGRTERPD